MKLIVNINTEITFNTKWTTINENIIPFRLTPIYPITAVSYNNYIVKSAIGVRDNNNGKCEIIGKSLNENVIKSTAYAELSWDKKT